MDVEITFQKHPSYRDSGVEWIGEIPSHWGLRRKKYLFSERVQKGFPDEPLLAATQTQGVVRKTDYDSRTVEATKDFHLLKLVKKGDFVISLRSFEGGIEFAYYQGIISPAYTVFTPLPGVESGFYRYFFKSPQFIQGLKLFVTGIREGQNIDYTKLCRAFFPYPPAEEAIRITNFLDSNTKRIETLIVNKRKQLQLMKEFIETLVLTGKKPAINNTSENWLGDLPAGWEVEKAKRIFIETNIRDRALEPLLAVTQDRGVLPKEHCEQNYVSPSGDTSGLKLVRPDDFVISLRSFQGGIEHSLYRGIVSPAYNVFRIRDKYYSKQLTQYYKYLFKTERFVRLLNTIVSGIRDGKNINFSDFSELKIPLPTDSNISFMGEYFDIYERMEKEYELHKKKLIEMKNVLIEYATLGKIKI